jgi:phenylacetate-CoA ligase
MVEAIAIRPSDGVAGDPRDGRVAAIARHAYLHSAYYQRLWEAHGISAAGLASLTVETLRSLPTIDEHALRHDWADMWCHHEPAFRTSASGGTTGSPKMRVLTRGDWEWGVDSHVRCFRIAGLAPHHRLLVAVPFDVWCIGPLTVETCLRLGCLAIPVGTRLDGETTMSFVERFEASAVYVTPTWWQHLTECRPDLVERLAGMLMLVTGEALTDAQRELFERTWRGPVRNTYGSEETHSLGAECGQGRPGMHLLDDRFVFEVVDEVTGEVRIDRGRGELAITSLYHEAMPLVRYRNGDRVEIFHEECPCGLTGPKINVLGKAGEVLVFQDATRVQGFQVEECLRATLGRTIPFQAVAERGPGGVDRLRLRLLDGSVGPDALERTRDALGRLSMEVREAVQDGGLSVVVESATEPLALTDKGKGKRFVDLREPSEPG